MKFILSALRILWLLLTILTITGIILPVSVWVIRWFICLAIPTVLIGASVLLWKRRWLRWLPVLPMLIAGLMFALPSLKFEVKTERDEYCRRLRTFENVRYLWGGENRQGIDCSGLVRQALRETSLRRGIATLNADLLRSAFNIWWSDFPAKALLDKERGLAVTLFESEAINMVNSESLEPGDLAVTKDGVHVLAYLGEGEWIEADPGVGRVIRVTAPVEDNVWFERPVVLVRWSVFCGG